MTPLKIAFVDDEPELLASLHRAVRQSAVREGWELAFFSDPGEALTALTDEPAAVVVLDLLMPVMGGLQLAEALRPAAPDTLFIVLSGCTEFQTAVEAINRANVFRYYLKPAPAPDLVAGLRDAIALWRAAQDKARASATPDADRTGLLALDVLAFGILITDPEGRIEIANRHAAQILAAGRGLFSSSDGVLRASDRSVQRRLGEARQAVLRDIQATALAIDSTDPPLRLMLTPFPGGQRILHFITEPGQGVQYPAALIAPLFDLTPAEARLVVALVSGQDLDEAATHCGITKGTARSYLKQIFQKTGVSRQAELIRLVLTSLVSVEVSAPLAGDA